MEQMFLKILNMSITASYCALAVLVLRLFLKNLPKIYSYVLWLIVAFRLICPVSFENVFSLMRIPTEVISTNTAAQQLPEIKIGNAEAVVDENRTLLFVGNVLWLMGATGFLGYGIGSYERMRRELRDAKEIDAGIFLSERLRTPFVLGYFKPQIYLPEGLSSVERTYVVEHERTHIRRGDHIIKSSSFFLMSLYWFNPVLWFSFFMM
ncbi:MAG: peptidase M56 BlaR1, partial [Lachnospiraceae bacterium]|nr:peptidase M56 BlaR1 [Lachnospiraceae bacterium]